MITLLKSEGQAYVTRSEPGLALAQMSIWTEFGEAKFNIS